VQVTAPDTLGQGVKKGLKAKFQRDDLIQENEEAAGIGFHLKPPKKEDLEYGFKGGES
jgi:hypothetical protein